MSSSRSDSREEEKVVVLFDFEYPTDSGKVVRMRKGEQLVVIKKTNPDWWQCRRSDDHFDHLNLFYAPVSYLKESLNHNNNINDNNINDNKIDINCNNTKKKNISTIKVGLSLTNPLTSFRTDDNNSEDDRLDQSNGTINSSKESLIDDNESCDNNNQSLNQSNSRSDSPSVGVYANLPLINPNSPPVPNSKVSPIRILLNHWAEYEDNNGRKFYYNSLSRETSWKPPRRKPYHYSRDDELTSHSEENLTDSSSTSLSTTPNRSLSPPVPKPKSRWRKFVKNSNKLTDSLNAKSIQTSPPTLPKGWTRKHNEETKELYFINDQTNEKVLFY
jgi:hypothetical protein